MLTIPYFQIDIIRIYLNRLLIFSAYNEILTHTINKNKKKDVNVIIYIIFTFFNLRLFVYD